MNVRSILRATAMGALILGCTIGAQPAVAKTELTLWSHYADHQAIRALLKRMEDEFEAKNPDVDVKMTFYEKKALIASQMTALRAGEGPDVIFLEPAFREFVDAGLVTPLDGKIDTSRLEPFAIETWTMNGHLYAIDIQASTTELYYRKDFLSKLGAKLPAGSMFTGDAFLDLIKKARTEGITPISQGIGDRPFPGAYLTYELLLRQLGIEDYHKLLKGELSYKDPRVTKVLHYMKKVIDAKAYPKTMATMKLGESHYYFHTKPGALLFPLGSWYSSRAFNAPDKGGQPVDFPLGLMQFPKLDGAQCPECKTIGVNGSYAVNANSKNKELGIKFLNHMIQETYGRQWINTVYSVTGIKVDTSKGMEGPYADYFAQLGDLSQGRKWSLGTPQEHIRGKCKEAFVQVMNAAFPTGLVGPDEAADMMDDACIK